MFFAEILCSSNFIAVLVSPLSRNPEIVLDTVVEAGSGEVVRLFVILGPVEVGSRLPSGPLHVRGTVDVVATNQEAAQGKVPLLSFTIVKKYLLKSSIFGTRSNSSQVPARSSAMNMGICMELFGLLNSPSLALVPALVPGVPP